MFDENLYTKLAFNRPIKDRFEQGYWSDVTLSLPGTVKKTTNCNFGLEREYGVMLSLWEAGFHDMPKPIQLKDDGDSIVMAEILYGTPLEELLTLVEAGEIPKFLFKHILDILREVLERFWATGFAHNDLHTNNILVGVDQHGNWRVWIIDFGRSFQGDPEEDKKQMRRFFDDL